MNGELDNSNRETAIDRRRFLALVTAGLAMVQEAPAASPKGRLVDVGPANLYAADGIYDKFRDQGFFLVRANGKLVALSSYCTHRICKVTPQVDHTFACKCHGSKFTEEGKVTEGPAKRDLPVLPVNTSSNGHLLVDLSAR
jgi:nitrite reductase/ring-hydroxylating ferredoxin subunit